MDLARQFRMALGEAWPDNGARWELLPAALATACVEVLPIDGAGVSLIQELRVPLGSSDDLSAGAEQLQVTLGEGPCLTAARTRKPVIADLETMTRLWPMFQRQLVAQTPFRSVVSLPLRMKRMPPFGAIDLYSAVSDASAFADLSLLETAIAGTASQALLASPTVTDVTGSVVPVWFDTTPARHRMRVWAVVGMLTATSKLRNTDALDVIRSYAFQHDLTLDVLTDRVFDGSLPLQHIWAPEVAG